MTHRPRPPRASREVSADELERLARVLHVPIEVPDAGGGWALLVTPRGTRYHALVTGVEA